MLVWPTPWLHNGLPQFNRLQNMSQSNYYAGCPCCVCRGIHCLVWHPGHNHETHDYGLSTILEELKSRRTTTPPEDDEPKS
jgi:hypothetical protein